MTDQEHEELDSPEETPAPVAEGNPPQSLSQALLAGIQNKSFLWLLISAILVLGAALGMILTLAVISFPYRNGDDTVAGMEKSLPPRHSASPDRPRWMHHGHAGTPYSRLNDFPEDTFESHIESVLPEGFSTDGYSCATVSSVSGEGPSDVQRCSVRVSQNGRESIDYNCLVAEDRSRERTDIVCDPEISWANSGWVPGN